MTRLVIHAAIPPSPSVGDAATLSGGAAPAIATVLEDPERIAAELAQRGIAFERWPARADLPAEADAATILAAYATEIARVQSCGTYPTVDAIRMMPTHPDRVALREKFLAEHTHSEDEVRFFVEGQGLFCLHLNDEVLQLVCEQNDWIAVPAGTRHWFDMGAAPRFCALRFFNNSEGWVAAFSGDPIAQAYPLLDQLLKPACNR